MLESRAARTAELVRNEITIARAKFKQVITGEDEKFFLLGRFTALGSGEDIMAIVFVNKWFMRLQVCEGMDLDR